MNYCELKEKLEISNESKESVMQIIEKDSHFLASMGLMDYSLMFIKSSKIDKQVDLSVMPAMICIKDEDGSQ